MNPLASIRPRVAVLVLLACVAAVSIAAAPARAGIGAEGEPSFGISGYFKTPPRLGQATTLLVRVWGEDSYDVPVTSVARISIPEGIRVISGDTVSVAHVNRWMRRLAQRLIQIVIRPERPGRYLIRGWLGIDGGPDHGADETDFLLSVVLEQDSVIYAHAPRVTRFENVRHGQRYRYAGRYLVPIDSSQALLEEDITSKAKAKSQEEAYCSGCPGPLPTLIPFVVMVGSDGRIRESRFLDMQEEGSTDPSIVAAASAALQRWEFSAARAGDRAVADFLVVRVPVKGSPALPERPVEDAPAPVPTGTAGDGQPAGTARDGEP